MIRKLLTISQRFLCAYVHTQKCTISYTLSNRYNFNCSLTVHITLFCSQPLQFSFSCTFFALPLLFFSRFFLFIYIHKFPAHAYSPTYTDIYIWVYLSEYIRRGSYIVFLIYSLLHLFFQRSHFLVQNVPEL